MDWFTLALLATLFLSLSVIAQKNIFHRTGLGSTPAMGLMQLLTGSFFVLLVPLENPTYPQKAPLWLGVFLVAALYGISNLLYMRGMEKVAVSEVSLLFAFQPLWILAGGVLFLGETMALTKTSGILLIMVGITAVYFRGALTWSRYHWITLTGIIGIASAVVLDRFLIDHFSRILYSVFTWTIPGIATVLLPPVRRTIRQITRRDWLMVALPAVFNVGFALTLLSSYQTGGEVSRAGSIIRLSTLLVIAVSYFLFNEKKSIGRKLFGGALMIIGVFLLK